MPRQLGKFLNCLSISGIAKAFPEMTDFHVTLCKQINKVCTRGLQVTMLTTYKNKLNYQRRTNSFVNHVNHFKTHVHYQRSTNSCANQVNHQKVNHENTSTKRNTVNYPVNLIKIAEW